MTCTECAGIGYHEDHCPFFQHEMDTEGGPSKIPLDSAPADVVKVSRDCEHSHRVVVVAAGR